MKGDYSWTHSAEEYMKLYRSLFETKAPVKEEKTDEVNPVVIDF